MVRLTSDWYSKTETFVQISNIINRLIKQNGAELLNFAHTTITNVAIGEYIWLTANLDPTRSLLERVRFQSLLNKRR